MSAEKLLTIAVPAYNSEAFIDRCLDSLVCSGNDVEVLVINDGSTDGTLEVARSYESRYPDIIIAVDQENRGWGGAINHALKLATGTYFYIVDSDDWLDPVVLSEVLTYLRRLTQEGRPADLFVVNYIYNRISEGDRHTIQCRKLIPSEKIVHWDDLGIAGIDQYLMIHNMLYRTDIIRKSKLVLPEHMSYMDSLVMLRPLRYVKTIYYHDCELYWYTIGRVGQSIETEVLKKHIHEQICATQLAIDGFDYGTLQAISPKLASCSLRFLSAMMTVSAIHLYQINTPESIAANKELWEYLRNSDEDLYRKLHASFAGLVYRKTALGRTAARLGYNLGAKLFKFA